MICGIKFCGGCNPRFDRGEALSRIRDHFLGRIEFPHAAEGVRHDLLLIIGGCTNCCATHGQYDAEHGRIRMWEESQIGEVIDQLEIIWSEQRR